MAKGPSRGVVVSYPTNRMFSNLLENESVLSLEVAKSSNQTRCESCGSHANIYVGAKWCGINQLGSKSPRKVVRRLDLRLCPDWHKVSWGQIQERQVKD